MLLTCSSVLSVVVVLVCGAGCSYSQLQLKLIYGNWQDKKKIKVKQNTGVDCRPYFKMRYCADPDGNWEDRSFCLLSDQK